MKALNFILSLCLILNVYYMPQPPVRQMSLIDYYGGRVPPARHRIYPSPQKPFHNYRPSSQLHYGVYGGSHGFYWYYKIK